MDLVVREQRRGKCVTLNFGVIFKSCSEKISREFNIDDLALVRFKFNSSLYDTLIVSLSLRKHASAQESIVTLDVNSEILQYSQQWTCTEHWIDWQKMGCQISSDVRVDNNLKVIPINITANEAKSFIAENIYQDSDWTDFILSTSDGSISVHRACLSAHSDVFKTMLSQEWKETAEGRVQIEGVTLKTLQHLKQYMYLGTLPDGVDALLPLLRLAACYLMDNLKSTCIFKLARMVTSDKLDDVVVFAVENKLPELVSAILQLTPDKIVHGAYQLKKQEQNTLTEEKKPTKNNFADLFKAHKF